MLFSIRSEPTSWEVLHNDVSTNAISNKIASGTHFHLDTLIAVILKWAVAPTTKTDGLFVFDVDAEPSIDDGHGGN
jgi:hypothetical protein